MCPEVLLCLSLIANDVEHLSTCLFAICISSSVKCLLPIFWLFYCSVLRVLWFANFSQSVPYPFTDTFAEQKVLVLMWFSLSVFPFIHSAFGTLVKCNPERHFFPHHDFLIKWHSIRMHRKWTFIICLIFLWKKESENVQFQFQLFISITSSA